MALSQVGLACRKDRAERKVSKSRRLRLSGTRVAESPREPWPLRAGVPAPLLTPRLRLRGPVPQSRALLTSYLCCEDTRVFRSPEGWKGQRHFIAHGDSAPRSRAFASPRGTPSPGPWSPDLSMPALGPWRPHAAWEVGLLRARITKQRLWWESLSLMDSRSLGARDWIGVFGIHEPAALRMGSDLGLET
jgi:hypothetical protein